MGTVVITTSIALEMDRSLSMPLLIWEAQRSKLVIWIRIQLKTRTIFKDTVLNALRHPLDVF